MHTMKELLREEQLHEREDLARGLKSRHIQMIAIGGAIGVGLFLGSARAINVAGPALLISYAFLGAMIFFIMRALGELLLYRPVAGSFTPTPRSSWDPGRASLPAGPTGSCGWSPAWPRSPAVAVYVNYWYPEVPAWIPALVTLGVLYGINLIAVGFFGEFEFWFAIIKVVTIIALIVIGLVIILFGVGELGQMQASPICGHTAVFPMGVGEGDFQLTIVAFAFLGVELVERDRWRGAESRRCSRARSTPWCGGS